MILPRNLRQHLARIYAFARTTDDLGDESAGAGTARLARWRQEVEACLVHREAPIHPVLIALRPSIAEFDLPAQPFLDLIAANEQDQVAQNYPTWSDLIAYCYLSAAPVGRLVLRLFRAHSERSQFLSDDVCIGLQLANFAQDVSIDRDKGRTYLVGADIQACGLQGAVKSMAGRALDLLSSGRELESMVPARLRMQLALYRMGGEAIVRAVEKMDYRTDRTRPHVNGRPRPHWCCKRF